MKAVILRFNLQIYKSSPPSVLINQMSNRERQQAVRNFRATFSSIQTYRHVVIIILRCSSARWSPGIECLGS